MRALGVDFGEARIGLAVSDDLGMLAHPLETVHVKLVASPESRIAELVEARGIEVLVVGLPLRFDGSEGTAVAKVRAFIERLRGEVPGAVAIVTVDERLSTVEAQRSLHAAGRTIKNSRGVIDQAAACVILQDYLDQRAPGKGMIGDDEDFE
jgi:putative Holliday junction resolvase